MAKRPERAQKEMSNEPAPAVASPAASAQSIEFRPFDAQRVDEEFVSAEAQVETAVEHYESAKTVSQKVLDARVCL